jgi:hypothetical protein
VEYELHPEFMLQPPWDASLDEATTALATHPHRVFGRPLQDKYPPMDHPLPPKGCTNEAVVHLVAAVNEAAAALPGWRERAYADVTEMSPYFGDEEQKDDGRR